MIEIDKSVIAPDTFPQFFAADNLPRLFEQRNKDLERLVLQFNPYSVLTEITTLRINLECRKAYLVAEHKKKIEILPSHSSTTIVTSNNSSFLFMYIRRDLRVSTRDHLRITETCLHLKRMVQNGHATQPEVVY